MTQPTTRPLSIVLAGGGSAGHTSPLIATAERLRDLEPGVRLTCIGTARGLETRVIPAAGLDLKLVPPVPLPRKPTPDLAKVPVRLAKAVNEAKKIIAAAQADAVVGFGGYVAMPAYLAARLLKVPVIIDEQNAVPGLANKVAARFASYVGVTFPGTKLPKATFIGMPLRKGITELDREAVRADARRELGLSPDRPVLLVSGGSQGARSINTAVAGAKDALLDAGIDVLHVLGPKNFDASVHVARTDGHTGASYVPVAYVDHMERAYAAADLMLGRSGAGTVMETAVAGLPCIFVPLPHGNGEQAKNADFVIAAGAGRLVPDAELTPERLLSLVRPLLADPDAIARMSQQLRGLVPPDAAGTLARAVLAAGPPPMSLREPVAVEPADAVGAVHFIAAGGSGMSGIAAAYAALGVPTSGSDQQDSPTLRHLAGQGVTTYVGHDPAQLGDAETVVVSSAIKESNVELAEARRRGLRVWHRSAALAGLMVGRRGVAITGTHGKTTTTGMTATMLVAAGADPSYVIGSPLTTTGESSHLGTGDAFVIEADESDGSFLQYPAAIVVVTNIEADHLDNWGTEAAYVAGFDRLCLAGHVEVTIACADDPGSAALAGRLRAAGRRVVTYGEAEDADVRLSAVRETPDDSTARLDAEGDTGELRLVVPGRFNLLNAAAAYAVGRELGLPGPALREAAAAFEGTHRRFQPRGTAGGVRVFDDYAHHPTELRATLEAARGRVGDGRLVACFQPHLFSRTVEFADELGRALTLADVIVCCGVYPAREDAADFPGVTGRLVADAVERLGRDATYVEDLADVPAALAGLVRPGDLVLTLGAGDVTVVGPRLVELLER